MPDSKRRTLLAPGVLIFLLIEVGGMCIVEHIADIANAGEFSNAARLQARVEVVLRGQRVVR